MFIKIEKKDDIYSLLVDNVQKSIIENVFLYTTQNGEYCVAFKSKPKSIDEYTNPVKPIDWEKTPGTRVVFDTMAQANDFLKILYKYVHPEAAVTNLSKFYKDQKIANQTNLVEYRYFFRPDFTRVWNQKNGFHEWGMVEYDIHTEYKELFGEDLIFEYDAYQNQIKEIKSYKQSLDNYYKDNQTTPEQAKEMLAADKKARFKLGIPRLVVLTRRDPKKYKEFNISMYISDFAPGIHRHFSDMDKANNFLKKIYSLMNKNCFVANLSKSRLDIYPYFFAKDDKYTDIDVVKDRDLRSFVPMGYWWAKNILLNKNNQIAK